MGYCPWPLSHPLDKSYGQRNKRQYPDSPFPHHIQTGIIRLSRENLESIYLNLL